MGTSFGGSMKSQIKTTIVHYLITVLICFSLEPSFAQEQSLGLASQVETLLISDIDDTIKNTHVLDRWDAIQNALRTDNPFFGMTSLFQVLHKSDPGIVFVYLSNAPENLMYESHKALLSNAKFPEGQLILRKNTSDNEHKNRAIRQLVERYQPRNLILIGDNGEQDTLIYARASAEFADLNVKVYIHQVYSVKGSEAGKRLEKNQIGFVTAVDLGLSWKLDSEIRLQDADSWLEQIIPKILKESGKENHGSLAFPKWINCQDFIPEQMDPATDTLILQYLEKRDRRCRIK